MFKCNPSSLKILLISLISLLVCSTSGFLIWQSVREHDIAVDAASRQLLGNARSMAEHAAQSLGEAERALGYICAEIAEHGGLTRLSEQQLHTMMKRKLSGMNQVGSGLVVNTEGRGIASSKEYPLKAMQVTDREYFLQHRSMPDQGVYLGRPVKSRILGTWVFTISRRLNNPEGSFAGMVAVSFRVAYFDLFYQSVSSHPDMQTLLLRTDGWPLAINPANEQAYQVNIRNKRLLGELIHQKAFGVFRNPKALVDDEDRHIAFARLEKPFDNLVAVVSLSRKSILSDWQRQMVLNASGAVFLMSVSVILALLLLRRLRDLEQTEAEVRSLNERLTLATEAAGVGVWDWNISHDCLHWDAQMYQLYGVSQTETELGYRIWQSALHPEDFPLAKEVMHGALNGQAPFDTEFRIIKADTGEIRHIKSIARVYRSSEGEPLRMVGINYDITSRKRVEQALSLALEAAEAANSAKSRFLANVSHEIRTPLNAIVGMTHLLAQGGMSERQREQLGTVESASRTLLAIINDLLDISRIEAGRVELELLEFSLSRLLSEQLAMVSGKAEENGLTLSSHVAPDIPDQLLGDPLRLGQILANLLSNAVKFTKKGAVSLEVSLSGRQNKDLLICFRVKDSGIGIPQERLGDIFTPFIQSDNSIARRYGGTGLGLAISSQLVRLMGGEIAVESEEGVGSVFSFELPLKPLMEPPAADVTETVDQPVENPVCQANIFPAVSRWSDAEETQFRMLMKELERQLSRQNMGALNLFRRLKVLLKGRAVEEMAELEMLLERLDFSEAGKCLRRLAEKFGISYGDRQ